MNFLPRRRKKPEIMIVSLIDIFAILLIFVIVNTTFRREQPGVTIKLPESKTAVAVSSGSEALKLSIDDKGGEGPLEARRSENPRNRAREGESH